MKRNQRLNKKLKSRENRMGLGTSRSSVGTQGVDRDVREHVRQSCTVHVDEVQIIERVRAPVPLIEVESEEEEEGEIKDEPLPPVPAPISYPVSMPTNLPKTPPTVPDRKLEPIQIPIPVAPLIPSARPVAPLIPSAHPAAPITPAPIQALYFINPCSFIPEESEADRTRKIRMKMEELTSRIVREESQVAKDERELETFWKTRNEGRVKEWLVLIIELLAGTRFLDNREKDNLMKYLSTSIDKTNKLVCKVEAKLLEGNQDGVNPTARAYFQQNRAVLYTSRAHMYNTDRRAELVHSHRYVTDLGAAATEEDRTNEYYCTTCKYIHTAGTYSGYCSCYLQNGGPGIARYRPPGKMDYQGKELIVLGYEQLLYLPVNLLPRVSNQGSIRAIGTYALPWDQVIDESTGSLHHQVSQVLLQLPLDQPKHILVEYHDPKTFTANVVQHGGGFLQVIKNIQETTPHQLTVFLPPYFPYGTEKEESYKVNTIKRQRRNDTLEVLCMAYQVPCLYPLLQTGWPEDEASRYTERHAYWRNEPLWTPSANITLEWMHRLEQVLRQYLEFLKLHPIASVGNIARYTPVPLQEQVDWYHRK